MPILSWFYYCAMNESYRFIGTCEFGEREEFEKKVRSLCVAHGWSYECVKTFHHYTNSVRDDLSQM